MKIDLDQRSKSVDSAVELNECSAEEISLLAPLRIPSGYLWMLERYSTSFSLPISIRDPLIQIIPFLLELERTFKPIYMI